jgi:hypothetical protein
LAYVEELFRLFSTTEQGNARISVMDPESAAFQPRDEFWRFQDDMLRVQQTNAELVDRVSRLERRQEEDSRLKNVWGTPSPFPSVLGGTPQQGLIHRVPMQAPLLTQTQCLYSSLRPITFRILMTRRATLLEIFSLMRKTSRGASDQRLARTVCDLMRLPTMAIGRTLHGNPWI